jgi:hypothetical protein
MVKKNSAVIEWVMIYKMGKYGLLRSEISVGLFRFMPMLESDQRTSNDKFISLNILCLNKIYGTI